MNSRVTNDRFPYIRLRLRVRSQVIDLEALIDTGFDGALLMPEGIVEFDGPPDLALRWTLADGSRVFAPSYDATVEILGLDSVQILVSVLGSEFLVGRQVTDLFTIILDHGQRVIIEP
jgi:predicted aspartyl protease